MANFVNEDGLYDVILDSRKTFGKGFRKLGHLRGVPQIRKTGGYIPLNDEDDYKTILAKASWADSSRVVDATANKRFRWLILVKNSEVFFDKYFYLAKKTVTLHYNSTQDYIGFCSEA